MTYRTRARTGTSVSNLALGAMELGAKSKEDDSFAVLDRFVEAGGNLIDTAKRVRRRQVGGAARTLFASRPAEVTDRIVLATKARLGTGPDADEAGTGRRTLDLYQMHGWDPLTPIEETLGFLDTPCEAARSTRSGCPASPAGSCSSPCPPPQRWGCSSRSACSQVALSWLVNRPSVTGCWHDHTSALPTPLTVAAAAGTDPTAAALPAPTHSRVRRTGRRIARLAAVWWPFCSPCAPGRTPSSRSARAWRSRTATWSPTALATKPIWPPPHHSAVSATEISGLPIVMTTLMVVDAQRQRECSRAAHLSDTSVGACLAATPSCCSPVTSPSAEVQLPTANRPPSASNRRY